MHLPWQFAVIIKRNQSGFFPSNFFFPVVSFILYYFCFYLKGKKRINCLFSILCVQLVTEHAFEIPDNIRPGHLIKELSKVIRSVEVRTEATLKSAGKIFESGHSIVAMH